MEMLKWLGLVGGAFLLLSGTMALVLAQVAPGLLDRPAVRWMLTGRHLEPSRRNRTLAALWAVLLGLFIWLNLSGYVVPALVVFSVWLPIAVLFHRAGAKARHSPT